MVSGTEDTLSEPKYTEAYAAYMKNAEIRILEGENHFISGREEDSLALMRAFMQQFVA